ncbi:GAF and ANTAR domain-containing protein [Brevibacterium sp. 'Marine']|uniref:GAF and ANTAR domain-containing protein n=1 Tax=Brevibacterium sp. 'Marine' TaxID=2725563 RepID=UPI002006E84E|nr:GAF and ANTAR domain-containing protein [Brevibacterium sp. 'Marine']
MNETSTEPADDHVGIPSDAAAVPAPTDPEAERHRLTAQIGEWARSLVLEPDDLVLKVMVDEALRIIPGVDYASLSIVSRDDIIRSRAPSDMVPERLDALQSELHEGPCFDSIREHRIVRAPDLTDPTPWPRFASSAVAEGVRSMLAFQLFVETDSLGALNLYSKTPRAFDQESEDIGSGVAAHASLALANAQKQGQLYEAVASRDLIGQAKGILMERHKISEHEAFLLLTKVSSKTNTKLREVAEEFVRTGALPGMVTD